MLRSVKINLALAYLASFYGLIIVKGELKYIYTWEKQKVLRAFASVCLKVSIYFSITTYFFFVLHNHFVKTPTLNYLLYIIFF